MPLRVLIDTTNLSPTSHTHTHKQMTNLRLEKRVRTSGAGARELGVVKSTLGRWPLGDGLARERRLTG